jgi:hypothetical protein
LGLTLSILAFTLSTVLGYFVFKGDLFAVKGGPNPGPRHPLLLHSAVLDLQAPVAGVGEAPKPVVAKLPPSLPHACSPYPSASLLGLLSQCRAEAAAPSPRPLPTRGGQLASGQRRSPAVHGIDRVWRTKPYARYHDPVAMAHVREYTLKPLNAGAPVCTKNHSVST